MNYSDLRYIYIPAKNKAENTFLLLHGTGGDENDLIPVVQNFGDDFNILSLRGNVLEVGMPRFFRRLRVGVFDEDDLAFRADEMVHFIKQLSVKENFDANKIIALGYSNGANITGATLFQYPDFLAGAILYRPMQPFKNVAANFKSEKHKPVFMSNGALDPTIALADTEKYIAILKNAAYDVTAHTLQASHNLTQHDVQLSIDWYNKYFREKTESQ